MVLLNLISQIPKEKFSQDTRNDNSGNKQACNDNVNQCEEQQGYRLFKCSIALFCTQIY